MSENNKEKTVRVFNVDLTEEQNKIFHKIVQKRKELNISPIGLDLDLEAIVKVCKRENLDLTKELQEKVNILQHRLNKQL